MKQVLAAASVAILLVPLFGRGAAPLPLDAIKLPKGFSISLYVDNVPDARSLAVAPDGTVFVGTRVEGKVYAIADRQVITVAEKLQAPNGVAFKDSALYVADLDRVLRFDGVLEFVRQPASKRRWIVPTVVNAELPADAYHGWRYLAVGPDDHLYLSVGAPCNACERNDPYGTILRMKQDGSRVETFARGIRNSVGMAWHPDTKELWFTDNGRDNMGDDAPPDELNRAPTAGMHFGFPYCHGGTLLDPEFGRGRSCASYVPPVQSLGAHVAALGVRFYVGSMFPEQYRKQIFVVEHGSWNRSTAVGYRIALVTLRGNGAVRYEPFVEGWLQGGRALGRPVDLLELADGSLLVSDDEAGALYRITYGVKQ